MGRPRRIAIFGHIGRPAVWKEAKELRTRLMRSGHLVRLDRDLAAKLDLEGERLSTIAQWCDILVSLGGDGTVLAAARALAGRRGALLPVNLGGLGFLAAAEARDLQHAIRAVLAGKWKAARRAGVEAVVRHARNGGARRFAMNDAVVRSAVSYAALHLRMRALGMDLGHLVADGLIAASASGSTAYSLSAGGPVLAPDLDAMIVTPACAHSLASRSLVLSRGTPVSVRVLGPGPALLVVDGQDPLQLERGDEVEFKLSRRTARVFENPDRPFLRALQAKLGWQGSARRSL